MPETSTSDRSDTDSDEEDNGYLSMVEDDPAKDFSLVMESFYVGGGTQKELTTFLQSHPELNEGHRKYMESMYDCAED